MAKKKEKASTAPSPLDLCVKEVNDVLKKYDCRIDVKLEPGTVMGQQVLAFKPVINLNRSRSHGNQ